MSEFKKTEGIIEIYTEKEFYEFINQINKNKKNISSFFRGQSNTNLNSQGRISNFQPWKLESTIRRSCKNNNLNFSDELLFKITKDRFLNYEKENKNAKEKRLETLCIFQHTGIPTLLIDFTKNIWVALYFAFNNDNFSYLKHYRKLNTESQMQDYATIFKIEIDNDSKIVFEMPEFEQIYNFEYILSCKFSDNNKEGDKIKNRLKNQESYFILDNKDIKSKYNIQEIRISYCLKNLIIKELNKNDPKINYNYLFSDPLGIYDSNFQNDENVYNIYIKANKLLNNFRYEEAAEKYEKIIKKDKNFHFNDLLYCYLFKSLRFLKNYKRAEEIFQNLQIIILPSSKIEPILKTGITKKIQKIYDEKKEINDNTIEEFENIINDILKARLLEKYNDNIPTKLNNNLNSILINKLKEKELVSEKINTDISEKDTEN